MRRSYHQFCGVARALDVVGERWTLLVVRNLLLGPRRYSDLLAELPGLTTNLLAARLQQLEREGLVERREAQARSTWALTAAGQALEPVVMELGRWGARYMDAPRRTDAVNPGWGLLSLKRRYRGGERGVLGVEVGAASFELWFEPRRLGVQQVKAVRPDATVVLTPAAFGALLRGLTPFKALEEAGEVSLQGDEQAAARLLASLGVDVARSSAV